MNNAKKVNQIMSYINAQDEFPFDVFDVEDHESVLGYFGFHPELDDAERMEIQAELLKMAEAAQTAEMARMMTAEPAPQGLYRTKYCTKIEQSMGCKEFENWKKGLIEKVRGHPAIQS
jgi:hypothetical protein